MLLYITAEDVFGDAAPRGRGPQRTGGSPTTLCALYDLGMRHHQRSSVLLTAGADGTEAWPDWQLDRFVIRIALYCRERLGLEPKSRAVVFGRFSWLWPAVDAAVQGFAATPVGIEHDLEDEALVAALRDAAPSVVFATDDASASRLQRLREAGVVPAGALVSATAGGAGQSLPLATLLEQAGTLDTAERAQAFRMVARRVAPEAEALVHVNGRGTTRLTHAAALERAAARIEARPSSPGELVCLQQPRATLGARLALAASVGGGATTTAFAPAQAAPGELARLRPHGLRAEAAWLEAACAGCAPRWPARLDRRAAVRRLHERLGDRLRWVETERRVDAATAAALDAAGTTLVLDDGRGPGA